MHTVVQKLKTTMYVFIPRSQYTPSDQTSGVLFNPAACMHTDCNFTSQIKSSEIYSSDYIDHYVWLASQ